ncbi:urea carboxylase [Burkholderia plantarii]|uniref:urea carboxylase n=1 Tax=Burkholderia plantarii TaxID=41899 RepID=UPI0006D8A8DF|nr:urea carboxylase [Burkholderia plantarii]ALK33314.1 urea amidolyase [Burkholderia plantarii]GLZ16472.1 urea carboxylase [Burkholderia plantarii]
MFDTVLIANRGEIACRIARTLKRMGIRSVAVHSDADRNSLHVSAADVAVPLGGDTAAESYLRIESILAAAKQTGAQAIIPGYGFLSEHAGFAARCEAEGIAFIGPTPRQIEQFGLKHAARELAAQAGLPLAPGSGLLADARGAREAAAAVGYPVMLKSTAGGGGIGLTRCNDEAELLVAFDSVRQLGQAFFANGGVFVERFVDRARHIEVQIFGDGRGKVVALGERDCSLQRRNQKVVEETPAPNLPARVREALLAAAENLGRSVAYRSAGTVEFIYDAARQAFYFLEVNARLQVEHAITESVTGIDLVEWMVRTAAGEPPALDHAATPRGAAIEVRLYAENPLRNFAPSPGTLTEVSFPDDVRVDGWVETGTEVGPHYDPMLAKLIVHGEDRAAAIAAMARALDATRLSGIATNLDYLRRIVASEGFRAGEVSTRHLDAFDYRPAAVEVLEAGTYTTIQDYPGRTGYWDVGVPPSGPMDDWAFRLANRIVGNPEHAAGIETTVHGPTLKFHGDAIIALTGAPTPATLDGLPVAFWAPVTVRAGQLLRIGKAISGCRTYLAVRHGFDVPVYLGSRATFALGQFGGHAGRTLRPTDVLPIADPGLPATADLAAIHAPRALPAEHVPTYGGSWEIGVLHGPHGAPDFFTAESIDTFFASEWEVHYNSNRLGIRLNGPKPRWTRSDGGEAGLHPSNIHDCEYAIGSINFTGDMPVILTRDGPSLGGFVCPVTIARAELWKVGQVKPGDRIRFREMSFDEALALEQHQDAIVRSGGDEPAIAPAIVPGLAGARGSPILFEAAAGAERPKTVFRQAGDKYVLVEYGENVLDLNLRFRVHALMEALRAEAPAGIHELAPGVRSLQVRYDSRVLAQRELVAILARADATLRDVGTMRVRSRIVHLPMAYEDSATLDAVARYRQSVRDTAPWLPSNTGFIQRINGLDSADALRDSLYRASYMVLGLGDVYLGAPCAVPVDPRDRLLTSKYNPARTYTAEGTVGIGGVYMCVYGMDSPGGYQLVGRTLPIWNRFPKNRMFTDGKPWLLRFFDQIRFYPVTERELDALRADFREGREPVRIEEEVFDLGAYNAFLQRIEPELRTFRAAQRQAFDAELAHWARSAEAADDAPAAAGREGGHEAGAGADTDASANAIQADISGSVWKLTAAPGDTVSAGDTLMILEAMKMEFPIVAPRDGTIKDFHCRPGMMVHAGAPLVSLE